VPSDSPIAFKSISPQLFAKSKPFSVHFLEAACLQLLILKIEGAQGEFKNP
jgi:hypothetical protein